VAKEYGVQKKAGYFIGAMVLEVVPSAHPNRIPEMISHLAWCRRE